MEQNFFKRMLALLLCLVMAFSTVSTALATVPTGKTEINYISFGDSMTNGLGHENYDSEKGDHNTNGFRQNDVTTIYPSMLKEYLTYQEYTVNYEQLAISAMRPQDINFLLRFKTDNETWVNEVKYFSNNGWDKSRWDATFIDDNGHVIGDYYTWADFVHFRFKDWYTDGGTSDSGKENDSSRYPWGDNGPLAYAQFYQDQVKNADVISLGVGNATLCVNLLQNMMGALGVMGYDFNTNAFYDADELLASRVDPEVLPYLQKALDIVEGIAKQYVPGAMNELDVGFAAGVNLDQVLECIEYTFAGFFINYWDMLEAIDKLHQAGPNSNENLDVIMLGMINTMRDLKFLLPDDSPLDFGGMLTAVMDALSAYYFTIPVLCQQFTDRFQNITFYIAPITEDIELLTTNMHGTEANGWNGIAANTTLRSRTIDEVNEFGGEKNITNDGLIVTMIKSLINNAVSSFGLEFGTISPENVSEYDTLRNDYLDWKNDNYEGNFTLTSYETMGDMLASAVYCALEKAIAKNAGSTSINMSSIMSLMGGGSGLSGVFGGVQDALNIDTLMVAVNGQVAAAVAAAGGGEQQQIQAVVTPIALITTLESELAKALCDDPTLGDLLSLLALCIINNGMGVHPNEDGHETLFNEIMAVYPDKPAMDVLNEKLAEYGDKLVAFLKENGADALEKIIGVAVKLDWLTEEQADELNKLIDAADAAIQTNGGADEVKALAEALLEYAGAHADEIINTVIPFVEEHADEIYALAKEYGPKAVEIIENYAVSEGWIDEDTLADLHEEFDAIGDAVKEEDLEKLFSSCVELAATLYEYAEDKGVISDEKLAEYGDALLDLLKDYGADALKAIVNVAVEQKWLDEQYKAPLNKLIDAAEQAIVENDTTKLQTLGKEMAKELFLYARDHADEIKDVVVPFVEKWADEIYALAKKYGPKAVEYIYKRLIPDEVKDTTAAKIHDLSEKVQQAANAMQIALEKQVEILRSVTKVAVVGGATYLGVSAVRHVVEAYETASSKNVTPAVSETSVQIRDVSAAQQWLNDNYDAGLTVDGGYGNMTKQAIVKALQKELGFTGTDVDGVAGQKTLSVLPELNSDSQGNTVVLLQCLLMGNGYGNDVEQAVLALQKAQSMAQTGVCDTQVWKALLG